MTRISRMTPENTEFVLLSFEGPDRYALAGGLGVRVNHLSSTLADMGFRTHLFFVGDPKLSGEETRNEGRLVLHRWCQWISRYHPNGAYEGEIEKLNDFNESIPRFVESRVITPALAQGKIVAVLGEEWHTAETMCRLSDLLHARGLRDRVVMFWNANNTFSFDQINWPRLNYCTTVTTVSRYMKHLMWNMGLNPLVIPNGIPKQMLDKVDDKAAEELRSVLQSDLVLCKIARWDPDKCWMSAIEATAELKDQGIKTTLLARGGIEAYGNDVMDQARSMGLTVTQARVDCESPEGYVQALQAAAPADVIDIKSPLPLTFLQTIYRTADSVLANSGHEPFGIVGLETMASGGIAFTGCTGEDYAIPFVNAFVLETSSPQEITDCVTYLREYPEDGQRIRKAARLSARQFTWDAAGKNLIRKLQNQARRQEIIKEGPDTQRLPVRETQVRPSPEHESTFEEKLARYLAQLRSIDENKLTS